MKVIHYMNNNLPVELSQAPPYPPRPARGKIDKREYAAKVILSLVNVAR